MVVYLQGSGPALSGMLLSVRYETGTLGREEGIVAFEMNGLMDFWR